MCSKKVSDNDYKDKNDKNRKNIIDRFKEYIEIFNFVTPGIIVILTFIMKIFL